MQGIMKGVQPQREAGLWSLLAFLADKDACQARALELRDLANKATQAGAEIAPREKAVAEREALVTARETAVADREAEATTTHNALVQAKADHDSKIQADGTALAGQQRTLDQLREELGRERAELDAKQARIDADLDAARTARADAEVLKADYDSRLAKLKALANG